MPILREGDIYSQMCIRDSRSGVLEFHFGVVQRYRIGNGYCYCIVPVSYTHLKHRVSVNFGHDAFKSSREFAIPTFSHMSASDASRYASSKSMGIEAVSYTHLSVYNIVSVHHPGRGCPGARWPQAPAPL